MHDVGSSDKVIVQEVIASIAKSVAVNSDECCPFKGQNKKKKKARLMRLCNVVTTMFG